MFDLLTCQFDLFQAGKIEGLNLNRKESKMKKMPKVIFDIEGDSVLAIFFDREAFERSQGALQGATICDVGDRIYVNYIEERREI